MPSNGSSCSLNSANFFCNVENMKQDTKPFSSYIKTSSCIQDEIMLANVNGNIKMR